MDATKGSDPHQALIRRFRGCKKESPPAETQTTPFVYGRSRCRRSTLRSWTRHHQAKNPSPPPPPDNAPSAAPESLPHPKRHRGLQQTYLAPHLFQIIQRQITPPLCEFGVIHRTHRSVPTPPRLPPAQARDPTRRGGNQPPWRHSAAAEAVSQPHAHSPSINTQIGLLPAARAGAAPGCCPRRGRAPTPCPLPPHQHPNPAPSRGAS